MSEKGDYWVEQINKGDLAVLAGVVRRMQAIVSDDDASMAKISQAILSDAGLTTKVLKTVNSVAYAQQAGSITTVSKASLILGIDNLRNIILSMRIIDDLLSRSRQQPLLKVLARSLQTALLARSIWGKEQPRQAEEAFIAGLLMDLGEAAYLSLDDPGALRIEALCSQGIERDAAAQQVLGVGFRELGRELAKSWNLGGLTHEVMKPVPDSRVGKVLHLCSKLSGAMVEKASSDTLKPIYAQMATLMKLKPHEMIDSVHESLESLPDLVHEFGAEVLLGQFEMDEQHPEDHQSEDGLSQGIDVALQEEIRQPDPMLQLTILREMAMIEDPRAHLNTLVSMTLEGLYRGLALDRALVALLSKDGRILSARSTVGKASPEWRDRFRFDLKSGEARWCIEAMLRKTTVWLGKNKGLNLSEMGPGVERIFSVAEEPIQALVGPLIVSGKPIGIIYADRMVTRQPVTDTDFQGFRHFMLQLNQVAPSAVS